MSKKAKVGDWIRIMRNGLLSIAEVRYIHYDGWKDRYILDIGGSTDEDGIYEVRPAPEPREQEKSTKGVVK